ncbi:MAG: hypothetical protein ACYTCU_04555 [Planctomycetota bacterium]|jgi:hypothetical protein
MNALIALLLMLPAQVGGGEAEESPVDQLVQRIMREMDAVNEALRNAADADAVKDELDAARNSHLKVIRDIEELIQQVKYQRNNNPQSGGGEPQPQPQGGGEQQPEPRESDGANAPEPQEQQPGDKQEQQAGSESDVQEDMREESSRGQQEEANTPPRPDETEPFTAKDTDARWGLLPPKMQERLLNLQVDDVPERYRTWLEAYIRALNRREQEGGGR